MSWLPWLIGSMLAQPPAPIDAIADAEQKQQALYERIAPATVLLSANRGFGSGFLVDSSGLILTCSHVVRDASKVNSVLLDGRRFEGEVVERGEKDTDLALIQIPGSGFPALKLGTEGSADLRVGSWVASVGHGRGGVWSFNIGNISNIYPGASGHPVFQTQIPLNPGNSGGPVVDRQARVVGVVTSGIEGSNSINFAIRIDVAFESLSKLRALYPVLTITAPKGVPIFVNGVRVGTGPLVALQAKPQSYEIFAVIGGTMKRAQIKFPDQRAMDLKKPAPP